MQTKQKKFSIGLFTVLAAIAVFFSLIVINPISVTAQGEVGEDLGEAVGDSVENDPLKEPEIDPDASGFKDDPVAPEDNPIVKRLVWFVNVALYGVLAVVTGAIIYSGIQFMVSQGNSQKTAEARNRIISSLVALALYALMFVILQWLIPGGVFGS